MKIIKTMVATLIISFVFVSVLLVKNTNAVSISNWNAGNIIDDILFYDNESMTVDEIQSFLNSKVPDCDTNGTKKNETNPNLTNAQYATSLGWDSPPYICLKDYYQVPRSDTIINNFSGSIPSDAISASQIIKNAADTYGISPKVLLVIIQKESLGRIVTDTWPLESQYKSTMGYACFDGVPCDAQYAGFYNQITNAARQFKLYRDNPSDYRKKPFQSNDILYNPIASCGSSLVYIENYATAGLYNYTPYQPNSYALNGGSDGSYPSCGAFGNRNFWFLYNDWFGLTTAYKNMETPRWMEINKDTYKQDPSTEENVDFLLTKGTHLKFLSKVYTNGKWYLRTEYDTVNKLSKAIPISDLSEISFSPADTPIYMELSSNTPKVNPITISSDLTQSFPKGLQVKISDQITVNGILYYRTAYDSINGNNYAFPASSLTDISFTALETPRYFEIIKDTNKYNPSTGTIDSTRLTAGAQIKFSSKITVNGITYFRTEDDTTTNNMLAVPINDIDENKYKDMSTAYKWMQINSDTKKVNPQTKDEADWTLPTGYLIKLASKITINNSVYYRTAYDTSNNLNKAIASDKLSEVTFEAMEQPRMLKLKNTAKKIDPTTGDLGLDIFPKDIIIAFDMKITLDNKVYLRSRYDTELGLSTCFSISDLTEI